MLAALDHKWQAGHKTKNTGVRIRIALAKTAL